MVKRTFWATLLGVIFGIICGYLGKRSDVPMDKAAWAGIIMNRAFIGFVIGISGWKINYLLHGILMGFIITLGISIYPFFNPEIKNPMMGFIMLSIGGIIWGFLIELLTTKVFKAPMK
jgi:hypothetical protein